MSDLNLLRQPAIGLVADFDAQHHQLYAKQALIRASREKDGNPAFTIHGWLANQLLNSRFAHDGDMVTQLLMNAMRLKLNRLSMLSVELEAKMRIGKLDPLGSTPLKELYYNGPMPNLAMVFAALIDLWAKGIRLKMNPELVFHVAYQFLAAYNDLIEDDRSRPNQNDLMSADELKEVLYSFLMKGQWPKARESFLNTLRFIHKHAHSEIGQRSLAEYKHIENLDSDDHQKAIREAFAEISALEKDILSSFKRLETYVTKYAAPH